MKLNKSMTKFLPIILRIIVFIMNWVKYLATSNLKLQIYSLVKIEINHNVEFKSLLIYHYKLSNL